jgi:hypothetical protein
MGSLMVKAASLFPNCESEVWLGLYRLAVESILDSTGCNGKIWRCNGRIWRCNVTSPGGHYSNEKWVYSDVSKHEYQSVIWHHVSGPEFGIV